MSCFSTGITKKINEITTLCGIDACGIIYDENNAGETVCPSKEGVQMVLDKFRSFPGSEQRKGMLDHEGFLSQSIMKTKEKLKKLKDKSKKMKMNDMLGEFIHKGEFDGNVSESDLEDLSMLIGDYRKEVDERIGSSRRA